MSRKKIQPGARAVSSLLLLCGCASAVAAPSYTLVENIMPNSRVTSSYHHNAGIGYGSFEPYGYYQTDFPSMNEAGDFAGTASATGSAATWKRDGSMTNLGIVGCGGTVSICGSHASAINDVGFVTGASNVPSGFQVYYQQGHQWVNGTYQAVYSGGQSDTLDINNRGDKVTTGIQAADYIRHGFVHTYTGTVYTIGNNVTQASTAVAVSPNGLVTGSIDVNQDGTNWRAYLLNYGKGTSVPPLGTGVPVTLLGTLGGDYGAGYDVNNLFDVVGEAATSAGYAHATAWFGGSVAATDLGTLGGTSSVARSINKNRQIVGLSLDSTGQYRAFLWEAGVMYNLNSLIPNNGGWTIVDAYKITDRGHVLARAVRGGVYAYVLLNSGGGWATPIMSTVVAGVNLAKLQSIGSSAYDDIAESQDKIIAVETDASGNIYRVGLTGTADMDYDPGPGVVNGATGTDTFYGYNVFVQKLTPDGQLLWVKQIVRTRDTSYLTFYRLLVDQATGDFYLVVRAGYSTYWDLDPGPGTAIIGTVNATGVNIAKYDRDGNYVRHVQPLSFAYEGAAIDSRGTVYIATLELVSGVQKHHILKIAPVDGSIVKTELAGIPQITKVAIGSTPTAAGPVDTLYLSGIANGTYDFNPGSGVESRTVTEGLFVTAYTPDLSYQWVSTISNVVINYNTFDLTKNHASNHFVTTDQSGSLYFTYRSSLDTNTKLVKHTASGTRQWATNLVGVITDVRAANDGVFVAGYSLYGGNLSVTKLDIHYPGSFATKFSSSGTYQWSKSLNGTGIVGEPLLSVGGGYVSFGLHGGFSKTIKSPTPLIPDITAKGPWTYDQDIFDALYRTKTSP